MSSPGDRRDAAGGGVEAAARWIEAMIQGIGDAVADVIETAGHAASDALAAARRIPAAGRALGGAGAWLGGLVAGLAALAGAAVKGALGIVAGALAGALGLLGGAALRDRALALGGLVDLGASLGGAILLLVGALAALLQRLLFLQATARALSAEERALLRRVLGRSMSLYNVRVVEGRAGLFGLNTRPFTLGNTIYLKHEPAATPGLLVHECVHAWQYQGVGPRYVVDALGAQALLPDAYDWEAELGRRGAWPRFNKEAQAELIEDTWLGGSRTAGGATRTGGGAFFEAEAAGPGLAFSYRGADYTGLAVAAATTLRGRRCARLSKLL